MLPIVLGIVENLINNGMHKVADEVVDKGVDAVRLNFNDVGFRVDTDPAIVKNFLSANDKRIKVVFSTYHSSPIVGEGSNGIPFDFAIFDEAHKTATGDKTKREVESILKT